MNFLTAANCFLVSVVHFNFFENYFRKLVFIRKLHNLLLVLIAFLFAYKAKCLCEVFPLLKSKLELLEML